MPENNGDPLPEIPKRPDDYITMTEMVVEMCRLLESVPEVSAAAKTLSERTEHSRKWLSDMYLAQRGGG